MRIFAKPWVSGMLQRLGMEEGVPIESKMISGRIEEAQKQVESQNFESRKHLLEYDDVMNKQREAVYGLRNQLLKGLDQKELIVEDYVSNLLSAMLDEFAPKKSIPTSGTSTASRNASLDQFGLDLEAEGIDISAMNRHELGETLFEKLKEHYAAKETDHRRAGHALPRTHDHALASSTACGKTTCSRWTTSRKASASAATPSKTRSSPTSASPSTCSKP